MLFICSVQNAVSKQNEQDRNCAVMCHEITYLEAYLHSANRLICKDQVCDLKGKSTWNHNPNPLDLYQMHQQKSSSHKNGLFHLNQNVPWTSHMVSGKPMEENQWTAKEKEISMSHKCIHSKIFSVNLLFFMLKKKKILFQQTSSQVIQLEEVQVGKKG